MSICPGFLKILKIYFPDHFLEYPEEFGWGSPEDPAHLVFWANLLAAMEQLSSLPDEVPVVVSVHEPVCVHLLFSNHLFQPRIVLRKTNF